MKATNIFETGKTNLREVTMEYGGLAVFIRHDPAEIWGVKYGPTLVISTLKITASTGVFVRVFCALKHPNMYLPSQTGIILT